MDTRNITFSLPPELIKEAKIYAAERDKTVNSLVRELLEEELARSSRARLAAERVLNLAINGPQSDVNPASIQREDLYERC